MSLPGNYPIVIYQGQTYQQIILWTAGPGLAGAVPNQTPSIGSTPTPVDLTGYTATMQFRPYQNPLTAPLYYDASSDILLGGTAGTITLSIPSSATEEFTFLTAYYDLLLTSSQGIVTPLLAGTVTIQPAVSFV
jgi:hypothetical protein